MKKSYYVLLIIFMLTLATRLILAFQTPNFTGDSAYFSLRQIENIGNTGLPLFNDSLSYSGGIHLFMPLFYYVLAFFDLFLPLGIVAKVIPNIFAASIVVFVYLISKNLTNDEDASLFSAFISGYIPVFFADTINTISPYTLFFPFMLLLIYSFFRIDEMKYVYVFLVSIFVLSLTSPYVVVILAGFAFYMLLVRLEDLKQNRLEVEVILFAIVFVVWFIFVVFKKAFIAHGPMIIWRNIPIEMLKGYFSDINILGALYQIGSLPVSYGVYSVYEHLFKIKERKFYVLIGFSLSTALLLWMKLIDIGFGLMFIAITVTLLFPKFYRYTFSYLKNTRFAKLKYLYFSILLLAFMVSSVVPSVVSGVTSMKDAVSDDDYSALIWLQKHSDKDSVVLSTVQEGNLISEIAKRRNVADTNFILKKDAEQRYKDISSAYKAKFETDALGIMKKYNVDYIYLSGYAKEKFGIDDLPYTDDEKCFSLIYNEDIKIYKVTCELK